MRREKNLRRPLWWLLPVGLAAPVAAGILWVVSKYGQVLLDALNVAMKMVVIP